MACEDLATQQDISQLNLQIRTSQQETEFKIAGILGTLNNCCQTISKEIASEGIKTRDQITGTKQEIRNLQKYIDDKIKDATKTIVDINNQNTKTILERIEAKINSCCDEIKGRLTGVETTINRHTDEVFDRNIDRLLREIDYLQTRILSFIDSSETRIMNKLNEIDSCCKRLQLVVDIIDSDVSHIINKLNDIYYLVQKIPNAECNLDRIIDTIVQIDRNTRKIIENTGSYLRDFIDERLDLTEKVFLAKINQCCDQLKNDLNILKRLLAELLKQRKEDDDNLAKILAGLAALIAAIDLGLIEVCCQRIINKIEEVERRDLHILGVNIDTTRELLSTQIKRLDFDCDLEPIQNSISSLTYTVNNTYNETTKIANNTTNIDNSVKTIDNSVKVIDNSVKAIDNSVKNINNTTQTINNTVQNINNTTNNTFKLADNIIGGGGGKMKDLEDDIGDLQDDITDLKDEVKIEHLTLFKGSCMQPEIEGDWYEYQRAEELPLAESVGQAILLLSTQMEELHKDVCKAVQPKLSLDSLIIPVLCEKDEDGVKQLKQMTFKDRNGNELSFNPSEDYVPPDPDDIAGELPDWLNRMLPFLDTNKSFIASFLTERLLESSMQSMLEHEKNQTANICELEQNPEVVSIIATESDLDSVEGNQLKLHFVTLDNYPKRKHESSYYPIQIPYAKDSYTWDDFKHIRWFRGSQYAYMELLDPDEKRIRTSLSGYFRDKQAANSYFDLILNLTLCTEYRRNYPDKTNKILVPVERETRIHRAYVSFVDYPSGNVTTKDCYKPPANE